MNSCGRWSSLTQVAIRRSNSREPAFEECKPSDSHKPFVESYGRPHVFSRYFITEGTEAWILQSEEALGHTHATVRTTLI